MTAEPIDHGSLRLWYLRAAAYAQPDFSERAEQARTGEAGAFMSADETIPGWSDRTGGPR